MRQHGEGKRKSFRDETHLGRINELSYETLRTDGLIHKFIDAEGELLTLQITVIVNKPFDSQFVESKCHITVDVQKSPLISPAVLYSICPVILIGKSQNFPPISFIASLL